ncbi:hypothetical protein C7460_101262 [Marinoscillum furvescens DSM 4134]|uniref:Uncharacterized protein n=1 Tax=Marinoscillum furvescens DSM 4134 TaxID=1122208 RepID=A0A3D9LIU7_MARFU|nr:hypothetical protein C7460_101262 [Marinoscillum furvescens DSM 4134]
MNAIMTAITALVYAKTYLTVAITAIKSAKTSKMPAKPI